MRYTVELVNGWIWKCGEDLVDFLLRIRVVRRVSTPVLVP